MGLDVEAPVVALDGPSGAGKGAVGQDLALGLGWHFLDSGALYRALAFLAQTHQVAASDTEGLTRLACSLDFSCVPRRNDSAQILIARQDVSAALRSEQCGELASVIAAVPALRTALLKHQRALRRAPGLVADGRDMGSVVFPDAILKVFLTATPAVRARRRHKQLKNKGLDVTLRRLESVIKERDRRDRERSISPLQVTRDAVEIDSSAMSIAEVVARVMELLRERIDQ